MMSKIYVNHQIFCWWPSQGCSNLWLSLPGYKTCIVSGSWSAFHCKPHILNCILQYYQYMCVVTIMCDMCLKCCYYDSMATATATMTNSMVIGKHNCPTSFHVGYFRDEWPSCISTAVFVLGVPQGNSYDLSYLLIPNETWNFYIRSFVLGWIEIDQMLVWFICQDSLIYWVILLYVNSLH